MANQIQLTNTYLKIYENVETERDRVEACIKRFGWTSDHNFDWFICSDMAKKDGIRNFVEFSDGSGILVVRCDKEWRVWSDPLTPKTKAAGRIYEFSKKVLDDGADVVWCDYVTDYIRPELIKIGGLTINDVYFSLIYLVLDMVKYNPDLPGRQFKEIRNAKNKFYREHKINIVDAKSVDKDKLIKLVAVWKENALKKQDEEDVFDEWYREAIKSNFKAFTTARVIEVDGRPVGLNAGYEVINNPGRFAGIIGIHDYSHRDLGTIIWAEDLEWVKSAGYKEMDMQGWEEGDPAIKFEMRLGGKVDRRTDTFKITKI